MMVPAMPAGHFHVPPAQEQEHNQHAKSSVWMASIQASIRLQQQTYTIYYTARVRKDNNIHTDCPDQVSWVY